MHILPVYQLGQEQDRRSCLYIGKRKYCLDVSKIQDTIKDLLPVAIIVVIILAAIRAISGRRK
jgi:hypothetical protein